ncbi:MAG: disulfide bond formation protein B [Betaproteobacteria bacterium]|nr:disulfide bond formation protein B [Betaproteobacteria bacterium]MDH5207499.1 disulfide bond formation protein B [Burkholderiaceae bacterium]
MKPLDPSILWRSARGAYFVVGLVAFGLIGVGLMLQHVVGLTPCPLCIFQRVAYLFVGVFGLLAAASAPRVWARGVAVLMLLAALTGAGIAGWHVWLQLNPESLSCGPGLEVMLENFPLTQVLPRVFKGSGDCADAGWKLFGISIAGWSLIWFTLLSLVSMATFFRPLVRK